MSEEKIDFERALHDQEYRHMVMERLNREEAHGQTSAKESAASSERPESDD
jgi:hypothetical protein